MDVILMQQEIERREGVFRAAFGVWEGGPTVRAQLGVLGVMKARKTGHVCEVLEVISRRFAKSLGLSPEEIDGAIEYGRQYEWLKDFVGNPIVPKDVYSLTKKR